MEEEVRGSGWECNSDKIHVRNWVLKNSYGVGGGGAGQELCFMTTRTNYRRSTFQKLLAK